MKSAHSQINVEGMKDFINHSDLPDCEWRRLAKHYMNDMLEVIIRQNNENIILEETASRLKKVALNSTQNNRNL